jgi:hypothetical protein
MQHLLITSTQLASIITEAGITTIAGTAAYMVGAMMWRTDKLLSILTGAACFFFVYIPLVWLAVSLCLLLQHNAAWLEWAHLGFK